MGAFFQILIIRKFVSAFFDIIDKCCTRNASSQPPYGAYRC
nr:MAG TPA: Protein A27 virus, virus fusion protein [Caudoviricetes sp.]DAY74945.1 MAG TPA: Protein A27 virus, virus fusion protein [Caudoviricetes sp.]